MAPWSCNGKIATSFQALFKTRKDRQIAAVVVITWRRMPALPFETVLSSFPVFPVRKARDGS